MRHAHVHHRGPPRQVQEVFHALGLALRARLEARRTGGDAGVCGGSNDTRGVAGGGGDATELRRERQVLNARLRPRPRQRAALPEGSCGWGAWIEDEWTMHMFWGR